MRLSVLTDALDLAVSRVEETVEETGQQRLQVLASRAFVLAVPQWICWTIPLSHSTRKRCVDVDLDTGRPKQEQVSSDSPAAG